MVFYTQYVTLYSVMKDITQAKTITKERKRLSQTLNMLETILGYSQYFGIEVLCISQNFIRTETVSKCKKMSESIKEQTSGLFFFYYWLYFYESSIQKQKSRKSSSDLKRCSSYQVSICIWFPTVWMIALNAFQIVAHLSLQLLNAILPHLEPTNQFMY